MNTHGGHAVPALALTLGALTSFTCPSCLCCYYLLKERLPKGPRVSALLFPCQALVFLGSALLLLLSPSSCSPLTRPSFRVPSYLCGLPRLLSMPFLRLLSLPGVPLSLCLSLHLGPRPCLCSALGFRPCGPEVPVLPFSGLGLPGLSPQSYLFHSPTGTIVLPFSGTMRLLHPVGTLGPVSHPSQSPQTTSKTTTQSWVLISC